MFQLVASANNESQCGLEREKNKNMNKEMEMHVKPH